MTPVQADLFRGTGFAGERLGDDSVSSVLYRRGHELFPDEMFSDLFAVGGRRSVPPRIVNRTGFSGGSYP